MDFKNLKLLIKAKGKCTTDHISMAGPWLKYRGHLENISMNLLLGATNEFNDKVNLVLNPSTGKYIETPQLALYFRENKEVGIFYKIDTKEYQVMLTYCKPVDKK